MSDHSESIAAAMKCLDDFMVAFNARDLAAWEKTFNFPSVRLASNTLVIIDKPGWHPPDTFTRGALKRVAPLRLGTPAKSFTPAPTKFISIRVSCAIAPM